MIASSLSKGKMNMPTSDAKQRAVAKYNKAKYEQVVVRAPKGYRDSVVRTAAEIDGVSMNEYIMSAVAEKIMRDHPEIDGADAWKVSLR